MVNSEEVLFWTMISVSAQNAVLNCIKVILFVLNAELKW